MSSTIDIKELDLEIIKPNNTSYMDPSSTGHKICIIGKPGTGKTTLLTSIIYNKRHIFPMGTVISGSEDSNHYYQQIFNKHFVYDTYDENVCDRFIQRQKIAKEHLENPWGLLILDDCTDKPYVFKRPIQHALFKKGRHWKMLYILAMQYAIDIPPAIRVSTDGCFILREPNIKERKKIWENYAGVIPDFKLFCTLMDQITVDFTAIYVDNSIQSNDYRDCVFWYKAKPVPPDFKFGAKSYREYSG